MLGQVHGTRGGLGLADPGWLYPRTGGGGLVLVPPASGFARGGAFRPAGRAPARDWPRAGAIFGLVATHEEPARQQLYHYLPCKLCLIRALPSAPSCPTPVPFYTEVRLCAQEFPHIAQRFCASPPSAAATATAIRSMLCRHCPLPDGGPQSHPSSDSSRNGRGSRSPSPCGPDTSSVGAALPTPVRHMRPVALR
jgi:hypothetical protein